MKWTTETPNKPGWYYHQRLSEGDRVYPMRCAYFAPYFFPYVQRHEVACFEFMPGALDSKGLPPYPVCVIDDMKNHRFCGPLPEPKEEKEDE